LAAQATEQVQQLYLSLVLCYRWIKNSTQVHLYAAAMLIKKA
jgi:hypothetical protein